MKEKRRRELRRKGDEEGRSERDTQSRGRGRGAVNEGRYEVQKGGSGARGEREEELNVVWREGSKEKT